MALRRRDVDDGVAAQQDRADLALDLAVGQFVGIFQHEVHVDVERRQGPADFHVALESDEYGVVQGLVQDVKRSSFGQKNHLYF